MKTRKFLLSLFVGALALLAVLAVLSPYGKVAADVLREWDGNWYWKDGGWTDYAPSGVPDFDQKQDAWDNPPGSGLWTYCGPVAAANSLWWFDSKFEPFPQPPSTLNDHYYLVTPYGFWDDHDPMNVGGMGAFGLVDDLAWYFDTDGIRSGALIIRGTEIHTMTYGLQWYLYGGNPTWGTSPYGPRHGSYYDDYHVQLVKKPTFKWVEAEVERSEDVILLLGLWQDQMLGPGEIWVRVGGHYVTVAGINSADLRIAFSDPFRDNREAGGPGRVRNGTLIPHVPIPGHGTSVHNDAGNVSHDVYTVTLTAISPGGLWEIDKYPYNPGDFEEQNCPKEFQGMQGPYIPLPPPEDKVYAEVEYAIAMSPFHWKPGGEWVWLWYEPWAMWIWEWWPYEDDGHSCLPDFWWELDPAWVAYDGPVAVANSFWWFDSKAETLVTGGWPTEPPTVSDHYNLVGSHGAWDDHHTSNTQPFIKDLATNYLNTSASGTSREDMASGISAYLAARGVASDFYTKTQDSPSFEWVVDEVETCEDVILLLGFYENLGGGSWQRRGGHWVNAAGVNRANNLIGLSDPAINNAISPTLGTGRVFPPEHIETPFTSGEQKDPQAISHDIYHVVTSVSPGGQWALVDYPATSVITDFIGLNGGGVAWTGKPISTEVEWAIGVSPYSDLMITKTAVVTEVVPGDRVTYTLEYANTGLAAVHNVTITDMLPLTYLTDIAYTASPPISATSGITYVWTLPKLSYGQHGLITITAESLVTAILTNTASITGLNAIGDPTPDRNPDNNTATSGPSAVTYGVTIAPDTASGQGDPGDTVTYTLRVTNTGSVADVIGLSHTGPTTWTVTYSSDTLNLGVGQGTDVEVYVGIPTSAPGGSVGIVTVTATSQGDPTKSDDAVLTTTVSEWLLYLPLIMRNYP